MKLETERLDLREFEDSDWQAVHDYASDPEVVRYVEFGPNTIEETKTFLQQVISYQKNEQRRTYDFAVILKEEGRLIGSCRIHISNASNREGWVGYCFNRNFWNRGYATEALGRVVEFGFNELGLHRIYATCDPGNIASIRVLEKTSMQREGYLREHKYAKGKWRDSLLYAVLESRN